MPDAVIAAYDAAAAQLIAPYQDIDPLELYAPVRDFLPTKPARIADIGAGTGRDAAWFATLGHHVLAVEPAAGLREAGTAIHAGSRIDWLDDRLPRLPVLTERAEHFDFILSVGNWHHLGAADRALAAPVLATLLAPGGTLIVAIRHGPTPAQRPGFDLPVEDTIRAFEQAGLATLAIREAASVQSYNQAAGVSWTWATFRRS